MKWETLLLCDEHLERGMAEAAERFAHIFSGTTPDLAIVFFCGYNRDEVRQLAQLIPSLLKPRHWIGCLSGGVIGQGRELEQQKAISISMASLPEVTLQPFHITSQHFSEPATALDTLRLHLSTTTPAPHFILLADPYTFDIETFLQALDLGFPESVKMGGLVSGGNKPGDHIMMVDDGIYQTGLSGVALSGSLHIDSIVSQGCRPIGPPMFITSCKNNLIYELDNRSPVDVLREIYDTLPESDQELFQNALTLGIAVTTKQQHLEQGDFLIRQIIGGEPATGHLAIAAPVRSYQAVQFHLRDPLAARKGLLRVLKNHGQAQQGHQSVGGLMFSCLGRGKGLFGLSNHDIHLFQTTLGTLPIGGFFCNGEIGPIHGKTFLHGFTSAFFLFGPAKGESSGCE
ncbi:MAG: FIST C-terminal domain-containing protein [Magnetococcales bacterium]|nr:FIST C-terminal domain-containing protein [Magnetococcales bacterium]